MTISIIDPAGADDADYLDLATWEAALGSDEQIAHCRKGNVGGAAINDTDPTSIAIEVLAGHLHDGRKGNNTNYAYVTGGSVSIQRSDVRVSGLYALTAGVSATVTSGSVNNVIIENILVDDGAINPLVGPAGSLSLIVRNCALYVSSLNRRGISFDVNTSTGTQQNATLTALVANCTSYASGSALCGISWTSRAIDVDDVSTLNLTARNCAAFGGSVAAFSQNPTGTSAGSGTANFNLDFANCASGDSSADGYGGTGHLVDQTFADWFESTTDLRLKKGSPGIDAGATVAEVTQDILGAARPLGDAYDIGAFEAAPTSDRRRRTRLRGRNFGSSLRF